MVITGVKAQYEVAIKQVENGLVVRVGCKHFVFEDVDKMVVELRAYLQGQETELSRRVNREPCAPLPMQAATSGFEQSALPI